MSFMRRLESFYYDQAEDMERKTILSHIADRLLLKEYTDPKKVVRSCAGDGYFFLAGEFKKGAIHSEPPIDEQRIFLSFIPCEERELEELKKISYLVYPKEMTSYYP